ncbi:MAG TPA: hypothetical protein VIH42_09470 [Thermoguttaceae bacterium]
MTPQVCPVCNGTGLVQPGFYTGGPISSTASKEMCRSCDKGIVWELEEKDRVKAGSA